MVHPAMVAIIGYLIAWLIPLAEVGGEMMNVPPGIPAAARWLDGDLGGRRDRAVPTAYRKHLSTTAA